MKPERVICTEPGDYRVKGQIEAACKDTGIALQMRPDRHFICSIDTFRAYAQSRKILVMEYFYREMRQKTGVLMEAGKPVGGGWNFDNKNRDSFGRSGPSGIKAPRVFPADQTTQQVVALVSRHFPDAPGSTDNFDYPVTQKHARAALRDFVENRLENFGRYQDAMVTAHPYLYHARLSTSLNLHLLDPFDVVDAALEAYESGAVDINSAEGFIRQVLGWREFVRGIYWSRMPGYADLNVLSADLEMPAFMWTAETDMNCVRQCVGQLHECAYAHHIQRLMVLGLFAMLLGVRPYDVHRWHMSMYADAVDWVSLPNVLGMSQYGDGGIVGTKPYAASGNYISKMSDYFRDCRYKSQRATGEDAYPFTTLYWDFLARNRNKLETNRRMGFQFKNLDRKDETERPAIQKAADKLKPQLTANTYLS